MTTQQRIWKLKARRTELKDAGDYSGAISVALEIIELSIESKATPKDLANDHNYASVLYLAGKLYSSAEWHARRALEIRSQIPMTDPKRERVTFGTYRMVLARVLASQYRFEEAAAIGRQAVADFEQFHGPADDFVQAIANEVVAMEGRTWS